MEDLKNILNYKLIETSQFTLSLYHLVIIVFLFTLSWLGLKLLKLTLRKSQNIDKGKQFAIHQIVKYFVLVIVISSSLKIVGIDVTVIIASSAALLVGIGLGLQSLFLDITSGIIILTDGSVKVDDIIEVNSTVSKVLRINLRTTLVLTRDDKYIILPNSHLTSNELVNWTHNKVTSRFEIAVGVDYNSDVEKVIDIMYQTAINHPASLKNPKPFVRLIDFGASSLDFIVYFHSNEIFRIETIKSEMRLKILNEFRENNITIPFPQRTLHINNET